MSQDVPIVAQAPYEYEVEAGEMYWWCACGRSQTQPLCDGSHAGTELRPVVFRPEEDGTVWFCGCKQSAAKPLCDGSHGSL